MSSGGKRERAGRPAIRPELKRQRIDLYVAPETVEHIKDLRKEGINIGRLLDQFVKDLCEKFGIS